MDLSSSTELNIFYSRAHNLKGLERLCLAARLSFNLRRPVKKEIINVIRTIDRDTMVFEGSLKTLLALVYTGSHYTCPLSLSLSLFPSPSPSSSFPFSQTKMK